MTSLKDALIKAWDRTEPCPDGVYTGAPFCPNCLYKSLWLVLEESSTRVLKAVREGEQELDKDREIALFQQKDVKRG